MKDMESHLDLIILFVIIKSLFGGYSNAEERLEHQIMTIQKRKLILLM